MRNLLLFLSLLAIPATFAFAQQYDLVLEGGRVMDPETGLDAVRNVGVRDGKIVRISSEPLAAKHIVHANGLVVAPGFIDLHQHGQEMASQPSRQSTASPLRWNLRSASPMSPNF